MDLERRPGETSGQHHRRLLYAKLDDRVLPDVDYDELSRYLYGRYYSKDVARRLAYGSYRTLKLLDEEHKEAPESNDLLMDITAQTIELQKERQRVSDQRREYKKLVSAEGRREHLETALVSAAEKLDETVGRIFPDAELLEYVHTTDGDTEAILVFSDWHYGMVADNVFNHYDTATCIKRVEAVVHRAIERIILHRCSALHIVMLGDALHGGIHCGARVASEELVADQLMQVSEVIAQTIEYLSRYVRNVFVHATYGNHARTIQNKKDSIHRDNMERLIPWWLTQRLSPCENVTVVNESENEFILVNSCGHQFVASHGDLDCVKSSPRLLATLFQKKFGIDVEYVLLGDKHHRESFEEMGVSAMICGSLCGTDDYANSKRLYSRPEQLLLIVNEEDGVDAEYRIKC